MMNQENIKQLIETRNILNNAKEYLRNYLESGHSLLNDYMNRLMQDIDNGRWNRLHFDKLECKTSLDLEIGADLTVVIEEGNEKINISIENTFDTDFSVLEYVAIEYEYDECLIECLMHDFFRDLSNQHDNTIYNEDDDNFVIYYPIEKSYDLLCELLDELNKRFSAI